MYKHCPCVSSYIFEMQTHTHKYKCTHSYLKVNQNTFSYFSWQHKLFLSANPSVTNSHSFKGKKICFCALVLKCKGMMLFVTMPKKVLTR